MADNKHTRMERIRMWVREYGEDGVYVSFSGGKDSTVLLDNVVWLKPKMQFRKVIETYGYPFISKEVSEAVEGARRYLHELTHRQTDRQTE